MRDLFQPHLRESRCVAAAVLLFIFVLPLGVSQAIFSDKADEQTAQRSGNTQSILSTGNDSDAGGGIPAEQLIQVLRNNPEVMVEVKSVIADEVQQNGVSIQPDALTDQQVYSQLESSATLRASVTEFLRARGYISDAQVESARWGRQNEVLNPGNEANSRLGVGIAESSATGADEVYVPESGARLGSRAVSSRADGASVRADGALRNNEREPNITDEPSTLHRTAPYNLRALRDLYSQVPNAPERLKRFGSDLFTVRGMAQSRVPEAMPDNVVSTLDVPLGPDYVVGPTDQLSITFWGGVSQTILRIVDREGRVSLPEAGPVQIAGLTLEQAQLLIGNAMQGQYRNAHVLVTVARVHTIRIFVVGDVLRPGAYDISALSSPLSALIAAGGPTPTGSLRTLRHLRNRSIISEIDLYDFLLHGVRPADDRLQAGDTLLVPPVGKQVAIFGAVKRPAIYELVDEKNLAEVLADAGDLTVAASLTHISIERVVANQEREEIAVETGRDSSTAAMLMRLRSVEVKDGDRIHVATVLPYSQRVVYLQGHVARPGRFPFRYGMQIGDIVHSSEDLLPEPADRGEIVRLVAPDFHPDTIEFSVSDVLVGHSSFALQPFDTIRIFGRYEHDAPMVSVRGEVQRPGTYPMFDGMTAAQLLRTAGGFKRDALVKRADLASYRVENGTRIIVERQDIAIGDAVFKGDHSADIALKPGDVLTVHQLTGWDDIGASITIEGEVAHPGIYSFQPGEHLSDVLRRAGGFRSTAYPEGAVLTRPEVAELEEKSRQELARQIEASAAFARIAPSAGNGDGAATLQLIQQQQEQILSQLRNQPATGRLVIHVDTDVHRWVGTAADIEVRNGDKLRIPKRPEFVLVSGRVYNPAAITFIPGHTAEWYLKRAGGATSIANRKEIFIIRANGSVIGHGERGHFQRGVLSTRLDPGDTIVVPQKIIGPSVTWRNLLVTAQVVTSLAIAASVAGL